MTTGRGRSWAHHASYWLRAQAAYDTEIAQVELASGLAKIKPWQGRAV